jgi:proteic killer suppression protein
MPSTASRYARLDIRTAVPYTRFVKILSVRHKGLKRLIEDDDDRGIHPDLANRVRRILTALLSAEGIEGLAGPPGWRIHQLTGDRAETWSVSVSGNWRITFKIDGETVTDLDLEDYH